MDQVLEILNLDPYETLAGDIVLRTETHGENVRRTVSYVTRVEP